MEKENKAKLKSYEFALKVVLLYKSLNKQNEFVLSRQLVRAATSIGANIEEGNQAQSKADFIHKFSISQKEAHEVHYWLRLLTDAKYLTPEETAPLIKDCIELQKIISAIILTTKQKYNR